MITFGKSVIWGAVKPKPIANIPFEAIGLDLDIAKGKAAEALIFFPDRTERWILSPWRGLDGPFWKLGIRTSTEFKSKSKSEKQEEPSTFNLQPSTFDAHLQ